ncbi:MAG: hypothetical protein KJO31_04010 [Gammaproteobacteria bacterium]|nr:hypothetical protein [Gammaproteobacteria bacterium]
MANALVVIVGALIIGLSFVVGIVAFVALAAIMLVLGAIIGIRLWWFNRKLEKRSPRQAPTGQAEIIEGEYRVVSSPRSPDRDAG